MFLRTNQDTHWKDLRAKAQESYRREDFKSTEETLTQAASVAVDNFGDEDPRYIDTLKRLAWVYNAEAQYAKGRKLFEKVYRLSSEELAPRFASRKQSLATGNDANQRTDEGHA